MPPHTLIEQSSTSPVKPSKHKNRDPARQPNNIPRPTAPIDRKHKMEDAADCTVVVPLVQLVNDYIALVKRPEFEAAFAAKFPPEKIAAIRKMFLSVKTTVKGKEVKVKEAELTKMWVSEQSHSSFDMNHATN